MTEARSKRRILPLIFIVKRSANCNDKNRIKDLTRLGEKAVLDCNSWLSV